MNADPAVEREVRELMLGFMADPDRLGDVADVLNGHPDYRVLRRFRPRHRYGDAPVLVPKLGLFVDVETTGLDPESDEIIQLAVVPFTFDNTTGNERIIEVHAGVTYLEQPSIPIPSDVTELTGIDDAMVAGQRIDDDAVSALLNDADVALIVAHFAEFDRPRIERRFPGSKFITLPWACSSREVEWVRRYGAVAAKLGAALAAFGEFTEQGHEALNDCLVGLHVLAAAKPCETCGGYGYMPPGDTLPDEAKRAALESPCPDCVAGQRRPLVDMLASARRPDYRLWVLNAPFDGTQRLKKARQYRWNPDEDSRPKGWYKDVKATDVGKEQEAIRAACGQATEIRFTKIGARDRYSARV